jgi:beta-galactosidase
LPFELDLSSVASKEGVIEVELRLDNRDKPDFPPGRPQGGLDFTYAGGLYRDVWLEVTDPCHLSKVYAFSKNLSPSAADVEVDCTIAGGNSSFRPKVILIDPTGKVVARQAAEAKSSGAGVYAAQFHVESPKLWDIDHPKLYRALVELSDKIRTIDATSTSFGIRRLEFDHKNGLTLNGKPLRLEGSNRHMAFPIIGNAASDNAQYREARKLKGLGLNVLRLAHYPQSPAFLDACDEVGLLVIDPIPGWQYFQDSDKFKQHVLSDVRETVTRDRNHPCIAIFEMCLNETYSAPDSFWINCSKAAHDTFGEGNFFTGGDSYGKQDYSRPIWDVPWTGWDDDSFTRPALFAMQKGVDREYGDYEFGGEESTSRAARSADEGALMLQAWNFIWSHNRNRGNPWSFGDLTWEAIDTYRGMNPSSPVSHSGLLDLFRLPKPVAYFYQSQGLSKPVVHIANRWSARPSPTKVVVFSNCDEVALILNGKEVARQKPDSGPTTGYLGPKVADPMYWAHGKGDIVPASESNIAVGGKPGALPFSGGNAQNLSHPPFTFDKVRYAAGKLEAVGYRQGRVVARDAIFTPGVANRLVLKVDLQDQPLKADGADFAFVYASIVDEHGQVLAGNSRKISIRVEGAGRLLGASTRVAEAGIAPFMIQSAAKEGEVVVTAECLGLPPTAFVLKTRR